MNTIPVPLEVWKVVREALEEIADHAPWGGRRSRYINWMRNTADKALTASNGVNDRARLETLSSMAKDHLKNQQTVYSHESGAVVAVPAPKPVEDKRESVTITSVKMVGGIAPESERILMRQAIAQLEGMGFHAVGPSQSTEPLKKRTRWGELVMWWTAGANHWDELQSIVTRMIKSHPQAEDEPKAQALTDELIDDLRSRYTDKLESREDIRNLVRAAIAATMPESSEELPPLSPHDHPESGSYMWSTSEMRAIQDYARKAVALAALKRIHIQASESQVQGDAIYVHNDGLASSASLQQTFIRLMKKGQQP